MFDNWKQIDILPDTAQLVALGMDFGFTNDPTTLVAYYRHDNRIIFDELIYRKGLLNADIAGLVKSFNLGRATIYADSADPKSIAELRGYGLNITGSEKGKDSINFGISLLQEREFYVTRRSTNLIKELRAYVWDKDRAGNSLNKPIDAFNHAIDALRYVALNKLAVSNKPLRPTKAAGAF